jgi:hypothetical protein
MEKTYYSISEICEYFPVKKKQQNYAIIIIYKERKKYGVQWRRKMFEDRRAEILDWFCRGLNLVPRAFV